MKPPHKPKYLTLTHVYISKPAIKVMPVVLEFLHKQQDVELQEKDRFYCYGSFFDPQNRPFSVNFYSSEKSDIMEFRTTKASLEIYRFYYKLYDYLADHKIIPKRFIPEQILLNNDSEEFMMIEEAREMICRLIKRADSEYIDIAEEGLTALAKFCDRLYESGHILLLNTYYIGTVLKRIARKNIDNLNVLLAYILSKMYRDNVWWSTDIVEMICTNNSTATEKRVVNLLKFYLN